jgi:hypothetical protein
MISRDRAIRQAACWSHQHLPATGTAVTHHGRSHGRDGRPGRSSKRDSAARRNDDGDATVAPDQSALTDRPQIRAHPTRLGMVNARLTFLMCGRL